MKDEILEVLEEDAVETQDEPIDQTLAAPSWVGVPSPLIRGVPFTVAWDDIGGATFYNVYQQIYGGQAIFSTNTITSGAQIMIPTNTTFQSVRYGVTAQNPYSVSDITYSIFTSVQDPSPPPPPPSTPPTTPPTITVPATATANVAFNISWGASTNATGGTITYELEVQVAGGSWSNRTSTTLTSLPRNFSGAGTFYHRVRAKNSANQYSDWRTSSGTVIAANRPPTTPPTISIDSMVYFNTSFSVQWGASTDPDGHTIVYYLERSLDGTAWTPVSSGSTSRQFTDTLGIAYSRVAYRVRAKDQFGAYSGWRTSPDRHISNRNPGQISRITVPAAIRGGHLFDISWSQSVDPDGHVVTYTLERAINGSSTYSVVYSDIARREVRDTITEETSVSVRYKVFGTDALGANSQIKLSPWILVTHGKPPTISGYDRDIGTMTQGFTYDYTATDPAGHDVALVEYINDTPIRDLTVRSGTQQTFSVLGNIFSLLPNGRNTIKIAAASTIGIIATRIITFTKEPDRISATYTEPEECRIRPKRINILPRGNFPAGAIYKAYATNNGCDEAPIWEDCTQAVNSRVAHVFQNKRKRSNYWGVNFKLEIFRDHAIEKDICTLNGISIQWE